MTAPGGITTREEFRAAVERVRARRRIPPARLREAQARAETERRVFGIAQPGRTTPYTWAKGVLPRDEGTFCGFLLAHGVTVEELDEWLDSLRHVRSLTEETAAATSPLAPDGSGAAPGTPGGPTDPASPMRPRWLVPAVAASVVAVVAGVAVAVAVAIAPGEPLPSTVSQPFFRDDFDGDRLDLSRWIPPADPSRIRPEDRELRLLGSPDAVTEVDVDLVPRDIGTFREIDFVARVLAAPAPGAGGAALVVTEQSGRTHMLVWGVSDGGGLPMAAALVCLRPTCASYDDYAPPPPTRPFEQFAFGESVPMSVAQVGDTLTFRVRGVEIARAPLAAPLASFRFNAYAEPGEQWLMAVDALRVYR